MAQIPEFSALTAGAQALVLNNGLSFAEATQVDRQNQGQTASAEPVGVKVVDHRMGRTPGPGQLPQFTALSGVAQQHVVDRGHTLANAKAIEDEIAASPNPAAARQRHWNSD